MTITLTEAGHMYIKGMYKRFTDKQMSVQQIKAALADNGILRTLNQVTYDLEERYTEFKGYAAAHQSPRPLTLTELAAEDDAKLKKTRQVAAQRPKQHGSNPHNSIADAIRRAQQSAH